MSSTVTLHPSTIGGIKRRARFLKQQTPDLSHSRALEQAARDAGFQNYKHALNRLGEGKGDDAGSAEAPHQVFVSVYWRDRQDPVHLHGRETLRIHISQPLKQLILPRDMRCRELGGFRIDADDHIEMRDDAIDQARAREIACAAARAISFMEATGLRPFVREHKIAREARGIPRHDHVSTWFDPESGRIVTLDEPYNAFLLSDPDRQQWALTHGYRVEKPKWGGLYRPGQSQPYLVSHNEHGVPLDELIERVQRIPEHHIYRTWSGESGPFSPVFVSPARARMKTPKRNRPKDPFHLMSPHHNSVGYAMMGMLPRRRPDAKMSLADHRAAATILSSALEISRGRSLLYRRLESVRCDLDEWVQRELTRDELPEEEFHNLYYNERGEISERRGKPPIDVVRTVSASLDELEALVKQRYPDCTPLREVVRNIQGAQKALQAWVPFLGDKTLRSA